MMTKNGYAKKSKRKGENEMKRRTRGREREMNGKKVAWGRFSSVG